MTSTNSLVLVHVTLNGGPKYEWWVTNTITQYLLYINLRSTCIRYKTLLIYPNGTLPLNTFAFKHIRCARRKQIFDKFSLFYTWLINFNKCKHLWRSRTFLAISSLKVLFAQAELNSANDNAASFPRLLIGWRAFSQGIHGRWASCGIASACSKTSLGGIRYTFHPADAHHPTPPPPLPTQPRHPLWRPPWRPRANSLPLRRRGSPPEQAHPRDEAPERGRRPGWRHKGERSAFLICVPRCLLWCDEGVWREGGLYGGWVTAGFNPWVTARWTPWTLDLWARISKRLRSPGINSKEAIPLSYVAWAGRYV